MPELSAIVWSIIAGVGALLLGVVGYFLKRTMSTTDNHGKCINELQQTSVSKTEIKQLEKDINHIKQTYVTKDEMKEMRTELKAEIEKLNATVTEIRDFSLPKEDYYRGHMETNRKLERLQQTIIDRLGGD